MDSLDNDELSLKLIDRTPSMYVDFKVVTYV